MKKITILAFGLMASISFSQSVDFESHVLASESYDNGVAGNGDFVFDYLTFTNLYEDTWGSWNGFSISNVTDNTTAGFGNQYASYTGSGNNNSTNFGVFYPTGSISVSGGGIIESFYITNTTYAAIAMRDGDSFSKQFGSPNDASGTPDGTNGEDFFKVWIIVEDASQTVKDSMEFYLADYRFTDPNDDYIVDTWEMIDLTSMTVPAASVTFRFESSDVGQWGINTPQYFAIDDVQYAMPLSVEEKDQTELSIYPNPSSDFINISGVTGVATIYNAAGLLVKQTVSEEDTILDVSDLDYGIYTVVVSNDERRYAQKLLVR